MIKTTVLSVQPMEFTDRETGQPRKMWRIYCADASGAVGSVYSQKEYKIGAPVTMVLSVNRDGKFTAKLQQSVNLCVL